MDECSAHVLQADEAGAGGMSLGAHPAYLQVLHIVADDGRTQFGAQPEISNADQGVQFTALAFTSRLEGAGARVSMDGRGRALDNVFVERLWRSVKYEDIYLREYATVAELAKGLEHYFTFYNYERLHQSLSYQTPAEVHFAGLAV